MSDVQEESQRRTQGRSPPFPFIPLGRAIERTRELETYSRGHPIRASSAVAPWKYNAKSSGGLQTIGALKAFGLLAEMSGEDRRVQLTDTAKRLLRNPPDSVRQEMLRKAALTPKVVNEFWGNWGATRPPDADCLWTLQDERGFTPDAAIRFLSVYDATLSYAGLADSANIREVASDLDEDVDGEPFQPEPGQTSFASPGRQAGVALMAGERIVFTEESDPERYVKLVAAGEIDETLLDALTDYVKRQRKRLGLTPLPPPAFGKPQPSLLSRDPVEQPDEE